MNTPVKRFMTKGLFGLGGKPKPAPRIDMKGTETHLRNMVTGPLAGGHMASHEKRQRIGSHLMSHHSMPMDMLPQEGHDQYEKHWSMHAQMHSNGSPEHMGKSGAFNPAPKKVLPKVVIGGQPRPGGGTGRESPVRSVRTQAVNTDDMRDDGKTGDAGDLSYKVKVTGKPGGWQKGDQETPVKTNPAAVKQIKDARANKMGAFERIAAESQYGKLRKSKCETCDCTSHSGRCTECGCMAKSMRGTFIKKAWPGGPGPGDTVKNPTCLHCDQPMTHHAGANRLGSCPRPTGKTFEPIARHSCNEGSGPSFGRRTPGCPRCDQMKPQARKSV